MDRRPGSSRKQGGLPLRKEDDKRQGAYHSPLPSAPCPPSFFGRAFFLPLIGGIIILGNTGGIL